MSKHANRHVWPSHELRAFLQLRHVSLLILLTGGLLLAVPMSAQSTEAAQAQTGSILGTVFDFTNEPLPDATVVLQGPAGDRRTVVTREDGTFSFHDVTPRMAYQITVVAEGFSEWKSSITVEPGQSKTVSDIKLRIAAVQRAVTVGYSSKEIAAQQFKKEEQQRILGFIPNRYVVYEPHPEPLTTKRKFELAYEDLTHPTFFARTAASAGIQQAANSLDYPRGGGGYGDRFGAALAGASSEGLVGNAILPSLLHQDPRYFYQGTGTKMSRARHAILAPFVCKGDNGKSQPNYSTWGGVLVSTSLANAYYPSSNRGAGMVFKSFGAGMALHVASSLAQEFILNKVTRKAKHDRS